MADTWQAWDKRPLAVLRTHQPPPALAAPPNGNFGMGADADADKSPSGV